MKPKKLFFIFLLLLSSGLFAQTGSVGINTTSPDTTAALDISSTAKGLLIPRMTKAQRDAIGLPNSPATGLQIYQTDNTPGIYYYNGTAWVSLSGGGGGASELQKITEGINTGWRLLGRDPGNFGNIGQDAVDLSYTFTGTTYGATGNYSTAMGLRATASGDYSTAMGLNTTASGSGSTAMNSGTTSSGAYSTAMGSTSMASGFGSIAMNVATEAAAIGSTAMGYYTKASGNYSTSMGDSTTAFGNLSVTSGKRTFARSYAETSVGSYNTDYTPGSTSSFNATDRAFGVGIGSSLSSKKDGLIVYKNGTLWLDTLTAAPTTTANRMYVLNKKLHYNGAEVGAGGGGASELQKITEGGNTGWRILGRDTARYGNIGIQAIDLSFSNSASTTRGATGLYSITMGFETTASGDGSTAMGTATAIGNQSTAMGGSTRASGVFSTSMGSGTVASGQASTAMGSGTTASGQSSTAMGSGTTASGNYSTAMGFYTKASGTASLAMGDQTIAQSIGELAIGSFNDTLTSITPTNIRVFTVGTGINDNERKSAFVVQGNGRVGIGTGTTAVTKGLVQIDGFVNYNPSQYTGYLNGSGATGYYSNGNNTPYSIWASHRIAAEEFNAYSDKRIKNVIGVSSYKNDLNTLAQIRITDYTMKDKVQYGDKAYKKVIAQELKEVYPQAVNMSSNTIPNIYQKATISDGWIALETDLVKGDIVKIITANGNKEIAVDEVAKGRFKVAMADAEVFVYGKQVNDFHTVDYEALTTLNVSATQALLKRIEELEVKNKDLTAQLNQITDLKNDIEAIKAQLGNAVKSTASVNK